MKKAIRTVLCIALSAWLSLGSTVALAAQEAEGAVEGGTVVNTDFEALTAGTIAQGKIGDTNLSCNQSETTVIEQNGNKFISSDCSIQRGFVVRDLNSIKYDNLVLEFSFRISDANCQFQSVIRSGSGGVYDLKPFNIEAGGAIKYFASASGEKAEYDTWYDVAVLCKASKNDDGTYSKTFAVFMKEDGAYTLKSQQSDTKSNQETDSVSAVGLWVNKLSTSGSRVDFDNIKVYTEDYAYDARFLLEGDGERLANEVSLTTDAYEIDNDSMTINIARGISAADFAGTVSGGLRGKIVSITDAEGNVCEIISDGCILTLSSHNDENILQYTFTVENLAPEAELVMEDKADAENFTVTVNATDDDRVDLVEIYINGEYAGDATEASESRYELTVSPEYIGSHDVRAVIYDTEGKTASVQKTVLVTRTIAEQTAMIDFDANESEFYQSNGFGTGVNQNTFNEILVIDSAHGNSYGASVTEDSGKSSGGPWVALSGQGARRALISYDIYLCDESLSTCAFIRDRSKSAEVVNQMPQVINGVLTYYDGGAALTLPLDVQKWYTIETEINNNTDTYSLLVTCGDEAVASFDALNLQKKADVITDMRICFGGGADGMIVIDNLSVDVFNEMPYADGFSAAAGGKEEYVDYTASAVYLSIPTGFTLPENNGTVKLTCADGEIRIKELTRSEDGMWLGIIPDYLESQGFEPHTDYDIEIGEDFLAADGKTRVGFPIKLGFTTTDRPFEVINTSFSKRNGIEFNVTFANETGESREALIIITAHKDNVFVKSAVKKVSAVSGTSTASVTVPVSDSGTVVKARIVNPDNLTLTNRIYEYIIK